MANIQRIYCQKNNSFFKCKGIIGNGGENGKCNNAWL